MRGKYIHDDPDWPGFRWDEGGLAGPLAEIRHRQGRLLGRMEDLGFDLRQEAVLETLTGDVVKSSEIEGERLDGEQVRSSVARRLGMDIGGLRHVDRNVDGVVEMMLDATSNYAQPLTAERLHSWHSSLFPNGPDRYEADHGRGMAGRQRRADAGGLRAHGPLSGCTTRPRPPRGSMRRWKHSWTGSTRPLRPTGCSGPGWHTCGS